MLSGSETEYELYNLYKGTQYAWSVTAVAKNEAWTIKSGVLLQPI